jgi:hypothetical protein
MASICPRGGGASSGPSTSQSHAVNSCLPRRGVRPRRCRAAPSGGCAQREAVHAPEDPILGITISLTHRGVGRYREGLVEPRVQAFLCCGIPHSASVPVHRVKAHENLHPVFEANHQRSTSSPPQRRHGPLPLGSHSGRTPTTRAVQLYSVQCTTLDGPARRSDAYPHSGRTPNAREFMSPP